VYNFGIHFLTHFSCKNLRKPWSKGANPKWETSRNALRATSPGATSAHCRVRRMHTPRTTKVRRSVRDVGPSLCVTREGPWSAPRGDPRSPVNSTALRHWLDAHAHVAAHHLPYRDLARIGHSQTAFSDVPGYKDPAAFSPRAQEPSHGRAAAPPMKTHGELHPPAACTANACCSCLT
jgi:hypothetical protein